MSAASTCWSTRSDQNLLESSGIFWNLLESSGIIWLKKKENIGGKQQKEKRNID